MNASIPERPTRRDNVRRAGIAGITAALLAGSALTNAPGVQTNVAWADEPPAAEAGPGTTETVPAEADGIEAEATPSDGAVDTGASVTPVPADQSGLVTLNLRGVYANSQTQALLDRINAIRAEAAAEGITVDGVPVSGTPLRLSADLTSAAELRAAEASFSFSHQRPDGSGAVMDGGESGLTNSPISAENLALNVDAASGLESWYAEKQAYLTYLQTGVDTGDFGHYQTLISDASGAVGLSAFTLNAPSDSSYTTGGTVLAAEFWAEDYGDTTGATLPDGSSDREPVVSVRVKVSDYLSPTLSGPTELQAGQTGQLAFGTTSGANALGGTNLVNGTIDSLFNHMTVSSDNPEVLAATNKGLLTAKAAGTATVTYREGDTTLATLTITVTPATIVDVSAPAEPIVCESGVAPTLPATLPASMSDGTTSEAPVTWDAIDPSLYSGRAGGEFDVRGVVEGWGEVYAHVIVNPAVPTGAATTVACVDVEVGAAPALPPSATVTWSNGETSEEPIAWDAFDSNAYPEGGAATLYGTVGETGLMVSCNLNIIVPAPVMVTVPPLMGWSSEAAQQALQDIGLVGAVAIGEPAPTPELVGTVYSTDVPEGTNLTLGSTVNLTVYGEYVPPAPTLVTVPDVNGQSVTAASEALASAGLVANVVTGDPAASAGQTGVVYQMDPAAGTEVEPGATIMLTAYGEYVTPKATSATAPADITIGSGETPELPKTVKVSWSDGSTTDEPVSWEDVDAKRYETAGTVTLNGSVSDTGLTVKVNVIVKAPTVTDVADVPGVTTQVGTAPELPKTVKVTWSNGDVTDETIAWSGFSEADYAKPGTFAVEGGVPVAKTTVTCTVTVTQAPIVGQASDITVTTPSGTAPKLPAAVTMVRDNGATFEADVTWQVPDRASYSAREGGTFEVSGTVADWDGTIVARVDVTPASVTDIAGVSGVTTQAGTAPELPGTTKVTWSNGDVTDEAITWDAIDEDAYLEGGTFEVAGVVEAAGNAQVSCAVSVEPARIVSVEAPSAGIVTPSGTAPQLPETLTAQMSNGTTRQIGVTWDDIDAARYTAREGGTFTVQGVAEGWRNPVSATVTVSPATIVKAEAASVSTQEKVAPEPPKTAKVTWSNGDVTDEAVTWDAIDAQQYAQPGSFTANGTIGANATVTCEVTVSAATIVEPAEEVAVTTPSGTEPALPKTVKMTYSNAEVRAVAVTWEAPDKEAYSSRQGGTFEVKGTVEGWQGTVVAKVTVTPATLKSVAAPADVTTPAGTAPDLPKTAKVTWSNGDVTDEQISWNKLDEKQYLDGGTFKATGTVGGTTGTGTLEVSCTVTVTPAFIAGVTTPADVTTPSGTAPTLPKTLTAQMSNGTTKDVPASWEAIDEDTWRGREGGTFTVSGTIEGWETPVSLKVTVSPATIAEVAALSGITIKEGTTPELPVTVKVTWSNGDTTDEAVSWENPKADAYAKPDTVTLNGKVEGWDKPVELVITVDARVATSVEEPAAVQTEAGVAPILPATAKVSWDNGTVTDEAITWDAIDEASYHNGGTFSVSGAVANTELHVSVQITVAGAVASAAETAQIETPAGIAPTLPGSIKVTWSNGDVTDEAVSWPAIDTNSYLAPGSFTLEGTFANAKVALQASAKVTVTGAVITGVDIVPAVSTVAGVAPTLPEYVTVFKSDGSKTSAKVTWDKLDPAQYRTRGVFTTEGSVEGFEGKAQITVKVASATVSGVQQQIAVSTVVGTRPELPATVQFTWSDGSTTNESVNWDRIDESLYQKEGSFQVRGIASGWGVTATVSVEAADVPKTGDASLSLPALITAGIAGAVAVAGGVAALIRKRLRG